MAQYLRFIALAILTMCISLTGCGRPDWSTHAGWPEKYEFQGQAVQRHTKYVTGDDEADKVARGQKPAMFHTYYSYEKAGERILHGKYTAWYAKGKVKSETTYIHGQKQDRTAYYFSGTVSERLTKTKDGEQSKFFDRQGKLIGEQMYDKGTDTLTCTLRGQIVSLDDFMAEIHREVYGIKRITP